MCQICVGLAQNDDGIIPSNWLLIDRFSTTSVGKNPDMSSNIRKILKQERLTGVTNGVNKEFNKIGDYDLFPIKLHFNMHSMSNIVALKDISNVPVF